jgi:hypothetical protein
MANQQSTLKEIHMDDQVFAGLTEEEWAELEWDQRYDPDGAYRGLVFPMSGRFVRTCLAPLGDAAVNVGAALWSLAFRQRGGPISCRDIRLLACRLARHQTIDYDRTLAALQDQGLARREGNEVWPLFYAAEKKLFDEGHGDAVYVPSFFSHNLDHFFPDPATPASQEATDEAAEECA